MTRNPVSLLAALLIAAASPLAAGQPTTAPAPPVPADDLAGETDPMRILLREIDRLNALVDVMREEIAAANLDKSAAERELEELRQFIADHHQFGQDFEAYRAVKEVAAEATQRREQAAAREQREMIKAERLERLRLARAERETRRAESNRLSGYRERGFSPVGLDVFLSRMAFSYHAVDDTVTRYKYIPGYGRFLRFYPASRIDFTTMAISGSVLNASEEVRNVGVAITFFDESGHQVGHETVKITNARPNVPYPFTSTVTMALDRPFATSSQHVLYADPVE